MKKFIFLPLFLGGLFLINTPSNACACGANSTDADDSVVQALQKKTEPENQKDITKKEFLNRMGREGWLSPEVILENVNLIGKNKSLEYLDILAEKGTLSPKIIIENADKIGKEEATKLAEKSFLAAINITGLTEDEISGLAETFLSFVASGYKFSKTGLPFLKAVNYAIQLSRPEMISGVEAILDMAYGDGTTQKALKDQGTYATESGHEL